MTIYAALPSAAMWLSRTALQRGKIGSLAISKSTPSSLVSINFDWTSVVHGGRRWLDSATFSGPNLPVTHLLTDRHTSAHLILQVSQTWKTWRFKTFQLRRESAAPGKLPRLWSDYT